MIFLKLKRFYRLKILLALCLFFQAAIAQSQNEQKSVVVPPERELKLICQDEMKGFPGPSNKALLAQSCAKVQVMEKCASHAGEKIFHYDKESSNPQAKKILVLSLIHGDETFAGSVGRYWMERLEDISPRNSWRIIPILNPDGVKLKTRMNGNKVDLNRNFPTKDWDELALKYWKSSTKENPRRYPGDKGGSEPETQCALKHIEDYQPDFVVSIHTPLRVLDFDGPKVKPPKYDYLPWKSLGHFPGSLGRFLWFERTTPVLTLELKDNLPLTYAPFEKLHDVIGQLVKYEMPSNETSDVQKNPPKIPTDFSTAQNEAH